MYRSFTVSCGIMYFLLRGIILFTSDTVLPSSWFLQRCVYVHFDFLVVALRFKLAIFSTQFYYLLYSSYTTNTSPFARIYNLEFFVSRLVYSTFKFLIERWNSAILCIPFCHRAKSGSCLGGIDALQIPKEQKILLRSNTKKQTRNHSYLYMPGSCMAL